MSNLDANSARKWIVKWSLCLVAVHAAFLALAPAFGYPLRYAQAFRLLESVVPVFLAYVGSAVAFLVTDNAKHIRASKLQSPLFELLLRGPVYLFAGVNTVAFVAFGLSNRLAAPDGTGMSVDDLARLLTVALSVLTGVTNGMVAWLFNQSIPTSNALGESPLEKAVEK